jgi:hypothetical protein
MIKKYSQTDDFKKEFYFYLGLLSTKFAIMEYKILSLLGNLIVDEFIVAATVLERNSLIQNTDLLKKINKYRDFETKALDRLVAKISHIRRNRNLFIHGIWGEPFKSENDIMITCAEPKILYEETKDKKSWKHSTHHKFRLSYIKKLVQEIDDIILAQDYLIEKLKENLLENPNWS